MATDYPTGIDSWDNPGPNVPENATGYEHDLLHGHHSDAIEAIETELGTNPAGAWGTVRDGIAAGTDGYFEGTLTYADEFDGPSLDAGWVRVDPAAKSGYVTWTQAAGALFMGHTATANTANELHCLMRPVGDAFVPGDAIVTKMTLWGSTTANYSMGSLILSDGITHGAGVQVLNLDYYSTTTSATGITTSLRNITNFATAGTTVDSFNAHPYTPTWTRLVLVAGGTWRNDVSVDGIWWRKGTTNLTQALAPTHMGILSSNWGAAVSYSAIYPFFRRYSGVT